MNKRVELNNLDSFSVGLTKFSVAIVEELQQFKELNLNDFNPDETAPEESLYEEIPVEDHLEATKTASAKLPPEEAVYRDTGIQRINNLIDDELKSFSKWDHPAEKSSGPKSIPRIKVILNARKAPEGVSRITCSQDKTTIGRKMWIFALMISTYHESIRALKSWEGNKPL